MAINETIVTGRKFRKLTDETTKQWQRFSFWTKASDVEFDDGKTLEDKIVNINGTADLLQEQVNNLNTDANGKINNLITEVNTLKETVEDLKTNPPSPPEQNFPLALTGNISFYANKIRNGDDEDGELIIEPWTNGTRAYLSSEGIVNGNIQIKYANGNDVLFRGIGSNEGKETNKTQLFLLSYPTTSYCPPLESRLAQENSDGDFWATVLGQFKTDGTLEFTTNNFPSGYLWVGGYTQDIPETNWISNNLGHNSATGDAGNIMVNPISFIVDFSQATFTQT